MITKVKSEKVFVFDRLSSKLNYLQCTQLLGYITECV